MRHLKLFLAAFAVTTFLIFASGADCLFDYPLQLIGTSIIGGGLVTLVIIVIVSIANLFFPTETQKFLEWCHDPKE